jgi:hypothetical protein
VQTGTWVTDLTGDMGDTFLFLFHHDLNEDDGEESCGNVGKPLGFSTFPQAGRRGLGGRSRRSP